MKKEQAKTSLKELPEGREFKFTARRKLLLGLFQQNSGQHFSAEDTYHILKKEDSRIGLATVYRTLEILTGAGFLKKVHFGDDRQRYELAGSMGHHQHHHLFCLACGKIEDFDADMLDQLEKDIEKKDCFRIVDHSVIFWGYCRECGKTIREGDR